MFNMCHSVFENIWVMETLNSELRTLNSKLSSEMHAIPYTSFCLLWLLYTMNDLAQLLELMKHNPDAFQGLSIVKIFRFVNYASLLRRDILLAESANHPESEPPLCLPDSIEIFLEESCQLPKGYTAACWDIFKQTVWRTALQRMSGEKRTFKGTAMY